MLARVTVLLLALLVSSAAHAQLGNVGSATKPASGLTNTAVSVKTKPGILDYVLCYNPNAAVEYVQVYDTAATVTVGTTTAKFFVPLTPSTVTNVKVGVNMVNAIQVAATTTSGGGTAPGTVLQCTFTFR